MPRTRRRPDTVPALGLVWAASVGTALLFVGLSGCQTQPGVEFREPTEVTALPHPGCLNPGPRTGTLQNVADGSGVTFVHAVPDYQDIPKGLGAVWEPVSAGLTAADFDQDGHVDLFFPQLDGSNELYWGSGNARFELAAEGWGGEFPELGSALTAAADHDADGDLDLIIGGFSWLRLLRNNGDRTFDDITETVGLVAGDGIIGAISWSDFDLDGDLDLFVGRHTLSWMKESAPVSALDTLWVQQDGRFTAPQSHQPIGFGLDGCVLHTVWEDMDRDGDPDLLQFNDFGDLVANSYIWENLGSDGAGGWRWADRLASSGMGTLPNPMGAAVRDLNRDGILDLVFSDIDRLHFFAGLGPFDFASTRQTWGQNTSDAWGDVSWSVVDIDLGGFGETALFLTYGSLPDVPRRSLPDRLLINGGTAENPSFHSAPELLVGHPRGNGRGVAMADLDGNGVPDLVVGNVGGPPSILLGQCTEAQRLRVTLLQDGSENTHAIGARVRIEVGERIEEQSVRAGGRGSFSGSPPEIFFGLGDTSRLEHLTVIWPDGTEEVFDSLCSHCHLTIRRGAMIGSSISQNLPGG